MPKRRTFTVLPTADGVMTCNRCGRKLRSGEQVTVDHTPDVVYRHAGRYCPRLSVPRGSRHLRVVQGSR